MISCGITPVPVRNIIRIHILYRKADTHAHNFRFPEIDMASILGSLPACFLEEHQWGSEDQYLYPTGQISDVIFKSYDGPIDVCFVSTLTQKKNIPILMCHEPAMRADILLDATILNITSKSLNMHSYTGLLT